MIRASLINLLEWLGRTVGKLGRLDRLGNNDLIPLRSTIDDAISLYGQAFSIETCDDFPESTIHGFEVSPFHDCKVWEWNNRVHAIVYYPETGYPDQDLSAMSSTYAEGHDWNAVNEGYLYIRNDGAVRLWCSVMPPIGVSTTEYWTAKTRYGESGDE